MTAAGQFGESVQCGELSLLTNPFVLQLSNPLDTFIFTDRSCQNLHPYYKYNVSTEIVGSPWLRPLPNSKKPNDNL